MSEVSATEKQWFGHPRGLSTLFFTEMWERFSYYGMRGILILFMVAAVESGGLGFDAAKAGAIYGLYTAAVYLLALPGGWLADRVIGQRRAVLVGGIIIALGHFSLAVPGLTFFYLGLVLIVIGTGLLKPNVSTMVGELYPEGGQRRDAGFSIFYMGINIGAFAGPLVCGGLGEGVDWHLGFSAAGIGMVLGLIQYIATGKYLGQAGLVAQGNEAAATARRRDGRRFSLATGLVGGLIVLLVVLVSSGMLGLSIQQIAGGTGVVIVGLALLYFAYLFLSPGLTVLEKKRVGVIFVLFIFAAIFWSGFEQAGSSMNLFAERMTDRTLGSVEMPASWLQSINPIFIIALAPVFAALWTWLGKRSPSIPAKFSLGLIQLGLGFLVMVWASVRAGGGAAVSPMWLVAAYFLHTTGELCLSPVGLSSVTKLAPKRLVGQMMGTWFMAAALGNLIAGLIGGQFENLPMPKLFGLVAAVTIGAGVLMPLVVLGRWAKQALAEVEEPVEKELEQRFEQPTSPS